MITTGRIGTPHSRITRLVVARPTTIVASVAGWITLDLCATDRLRLVAVNEDEGDE